MITLAILAPVLKVAAVFAACRIAWWLLGDVVLDAVDLPF